MTREEEFIKAVGIELTKARTKFPTNKYKLASLMEEVGEVSNAFLQHEYGKQTPEDIFGECVQVASCAMRLALEGDESFPKYQPSTQLKIEFNS